MRFNCGPDAAERARLWQDKQDRLAQWHDWFAWRPVRVGNRDCRWLETVERRLYKSVYGLSYPQYRAKPK